MAPFTVKRNINKCKVAVLNHNCKKLTVIILYYCNNFATTSCNHFGDLKHAIMCLKCSIILVAPWEQLPL